MNEKTCWAYLADNPFFVDLFATFQDDQFCYFVMEPVLGGQLQDIMLESSNERLNEPSVMFYAGNHNFSFFFALIYKFFLLKPRLSAILFVVTI